MVQTAFLNKQYTYINKQKEQYEQREITGEQVELNNENLHKLCSLQHIRMPELKMILVGM